jgi:hypothetical protein
VLKPALNFARAFRRAPIFCEKPMSERENYTLPLNRLNGPKITRREAGQKIAYIYQRLAPEFP